MNTNYPILLNRLKWMDTKNYILESMFVKIVSKCASLNRVVGEYSITLRYITKQNTKWTLTQHNCIDAIHINTTNDSYSRRVATVISAIVAHNRLTELNRSVHIFDGSITEVRDYCDSFHILPLEFQVIVLLEMPCVITTGQLTKFITGQVGER